MTIRLFNYHSFTKLDFSKLEIGDICFLMKDDRIYIWLHYQDNILLSDDDVSVSACFSFLSDSNLEPGILFCYDNLHQRCGNIKILSTFKEQISDNYIKALLTNSIDILSYKEDKIDLTLLSYLMGLPIMKINIPWTKERQKYKSEEAINVKVHENRAFLSVEEAPFIIESRHPTDYCFFEYLNLTDQAYWLNNYKKVQKVHDIYRALKKRDSRSFYQSFKKFSTDHKDLNLYSLKKVEPNAPVDTKEENKNNMDFLFRCLHEHGFVHSEGNVWISSDGEEYILNFSKRK